MSAPADAEPWIVDVSDLAEGQTRAVAFGDVRILVCHADGGFYAIENRCPHAMVTLDQGALRGCILECPVHGGTLDVRDGSPQGQPIRRPALTYHVRERGTSIEITSAT